MRQQPLKMKRLSPRKQLFYVECLDYEGDFDEETPKSLLSTSLSKYASLAKCRHCNYHDTFNTNFITCKKENSC